MGVRGYLLLLVALILAFLGILVLPYSLLARLNAERTLKSQAALQALYLAEAGAWEAIAFIQANPTNPTYAPQPVLVCQTSSPCTSNSGDFVGRYCYSTGSLGGVSCAIAQTISGGKRRFTISAVGESDGAIARVRAVYNATDDVVEEWEVGP
ncbi:hypothetical protein [Thermus sp. 93170]|jgi:hypothetical protein|uniref:Uncharacterized protein n=1 Tax=Thermus brockianus TaxID=56956 RepID=A0A1J0LVL3_THEBO|nr:hypothetical protein A0O31_01388 [Thermus brockianus]